MTYPQLYQQELIELAEIVGISAAPRVFRYVVEKLRNNNITITTSVVRSYRMDLLEHKILLDLLALPASPEDIYTLLKTLSQSPTQLTTDERTHIFALSIKK